MSDDIYKTEGVEAYRLHQEQNLDEPFPKGVAFPFIRRFLSINKAFPAQLPVEVVLRFPQDAYTVELLDAIPQPARAGGAA